MNHLFLIVILLTISILSFIEATTTTQNSVTTTAALTSSTNAPATTVPTPIPTITTTQKDCILVCRPFYDESYLNYVVALTNNTKADRCICQDQVNGSQIFNPNWLGISLLAMAQFIIFVWSVNYICIDKEQPDSEFYLFFLSLSYPKKITVTNFFKTTSLCRINNKNLPKHAQ